MKAGWIVAVCACLCANRILGANINLDNFDTQEPILRVSPAAGQDVDLFGYSITAHQIETLDPGLTDAAEVMADALGKTRIIIGTPKGTYPGGLNLMDPGMPASSQTGLVFSCPVSPGSCEGVMGGPDTADVDNDGGFGQGRLFDHRPAAQEPQGAGLPERTNENKTGQLLGALVLSTGDNLLVCAPRWTHLVNQGSLPFGRCYITDRDLTNLRMLQPCTMGIPGRTTNTDGAQGYCTAGTGAVITDDLIAIGTPGYLQLRGTVWYHDFSSTAIGSAVIGSSMTPDATGTLVDVNDIYTGFRVTSGQIVFPRGAGRANIIASVPRYNQTAGKYGRVNVYDIPSPPTLGDDTLLMASAEGEQIGEFFGYSVIVADLDGDNYDDIVVGAPMYSDIDMGRVESGRVYIFRNLQNSTLASTPVILQGLVARGRFGSSLTSLGDVDNDGYEDFAVGAPYTISTENTGNTGTVFIYYGRGDVSRIAEQEPFEVTADEMVSRVDGLDDLKTFGWSLSGGVDVDANGYNDLVVGAYQSQSVFVIRSIPVADVYVQLEAMLPIAGRINLEGEGSNVCLVDGVNYPCFTLMIQSNYTGEGLTGPLTVNYTLREVVSSVQRLFFDVTDRPNEVSGSLTFTDVGVVFTSPVIDVFIFTLDEISSLDTLRLEIQLEQNFGPDRMGDGNQTVASLSGFPRVRQQGDPQLQVTLVTNCGEVCDADLDLMPVGVVFQNRDGSDTVDEFVAGTVGAVDFILRYQNTAEQDAINNELNFIIPDIFGRSVISAADCTTNGRDVLCQLQDRLTQRDGVQMVTIRLTVDQVVQITDGQVDVAFTINTLVSRDNNTTNNMRTASFTVTAQADIFVTQQFTPNRIIYRQGLTFPTDVNTLDRLGILDTVLVVTVGNAGPSTIQSAQLTIFFPAESGDTRYLYLFSVTSITSQDTTLVCDDSVINPDGLVIPTVMSGGRRRRSVTNLAHKRRRREAIASLTRKPRQTTNPTTELDCTNNLEACVVIRCDIMSFPTSEIRIEIASRVNEAFFTTQDSDFILTAYANVTITSTVQEVDDRQNSAEAEITLTPSRLGDEEDSNVLIHPIIWPIIGGVLLLILIVLLLYFCGFFRRKKKPEDEIPEGDFDPNKFNVEPVDPKKEVEATTL